MGSQNDEGEKGVFADAKKMNYYEMCTNKNVIVNDQ